MCDQCSNGLVDNMVGDDCNFDDGEGPCSRCNAGTGHHPVYKVWNVGTSDTCTKCTGDEFGLGANGKGVCGGAQHGQCVGTHYTLSVVNPADGIVSVVSVNQVNKELGSCHCLDDLYSGPTCALCTQDTQCGTGGTCESGTCVCASTDGVTMKAGFYCEIDYDMSHMEAKLADPERVWERYMPHRLTDGTKSIILVECSGRGTYNYVTNQCDCDSTFFDPDHYCMDYK